MVGKEVIEKDIVYDELFFRACVTRSFSHLTIAY